MKKYQPKIDLANNIQSQYQQRRLSGDKIPGPSLCIVPSLYQIALQSYMPTFINGGCQQINIPQKMYEQLLLLLPNDVDLQTVIKIQNQKFWNQKLLLDYKDGSVQNDTRDAYFNHLLLCLLLDKRPPNSLGEFISCEDQLNRLNDAVALNQITLSGISITVKPGFKYYEQLTKFELPTIAFKINVKPNQQYDQQLREATHIEEQQQTEKKNKNYITAKPLHEIFANEFYDSVFPYHNIYNKDEMATIESKKVEKKQQLLQMSQQCYISNKDILGIQQLLRGTSNKKPLQVLKIIDSGLQDEQANVLAVFISDSQLKYLDLSNNYLNDVTQLLKLTVSEQKNYITHLNLNRNNLLDNSCYMFMKALQQPTTVLEGLSVAGNNISSGFILIFNGILTAANKSNAKSLKYLNIAECNITFKQEHYNVVLKLFEESGVKHLNISGNDYETTFDISSLQEEIKTKYQGQLDIIGLKCIDFIDPLKSTVVDTK